MFATSLVEFIPYSSGGVGFYIASFSVFFVISFLKGTSGGGFGILAVPIMALFIPVVDATVIAAPLFCLMDIFAINAYPPKTWDKDNLKIIVPACLGGILVGGILLDTLNTVAIELLVATIAVVFAGKWFIERLLKKPVPPRTRANAVKGIFWGMVSGFTSVLAHSGGPPISVYLLPQRLDKTIFAGTNVVFFMVGNYFKILPFIFLGLITAKTGIASLLIAPIVPLGIFAGKRFHDVLSQEIIYRVCYGLILIVGLKLAGDALSAP